MDNNPLVRIQIELLGATGVRVDGKPVEGLYNQAFALLAYLVAEPGRAHSRDTLAELLWPDEDSEAARRNLRQALFRLRRALQDESNPTPLIQADRTRVRFFPAPNVSVDTIRFDALIAQARQGPTDRGLRLLEHAAELYRGDFLADLLFAQSSDFDSWRETLRETYRRRAYSLLEQLAVHFERAGDLDAAIAHARRLVAVEPWLEEGHRLLMRLLAADGQVAAALAQFETCKTALRNELGVAPQEDTVRLAAALAQRENPAPELMPPPLPSAAARRLVTLAWVSPQLPAEVDPEEAFQDLAALSGACDELARYYSGTHLPQSTGEQLVVFGYPRLRERDAVRAAHLAVQLLQDLHSGRLGPRLALKIGLATGDALIQPAPGGPVLLGELSQEAAQLAARSRANQVRANAACAALIRRRFNLKSLGLKSFLLQGPRQPTREFLQQCPLVGRERELSVLAERWAQASRGRGCALLIRGDGGMGKTRLARSFVESLLPSARRLLRLACEEDRETTAFAPFIDFIPKFCGFQSTDTAGRKREKLRQAMGVAELRPEELRALEHLLAIDEGLSPLGLSPLALHQRLREVLVKLYQAGAREPLVCLVEDAHWMDPSSMEVLVQMAALAPSLPVLLLITTRPELDAGALAAQPLDLAPLDAAASESLARQLLRGRQVPAAWLAQIRDWGEGVPLFIEEITRSVAEADDPDLQRVPASLQESLLARLERIEDALPVIQAAAVVGREFDLSTLAALTGRGTDETGQIVEQLADAWLIVPNEGSTHLFRFRHALIRDVAYGALTPAAARKLHRALLDYWRERRIEVPPEVAADHQLRAGEPREAARAFYRAGAQAFRRAELVEAVHLQRQALAALARCPAGEERDRQELQVQIALGFPLQVLEGAQAEAAAAYERARSLIATLPADARLLPALRGLASFYISRGDYLSSEALTAQAREIAAAAGDRWALADAATAAGIGRVIRGDLEAAVEALEQGLAVVDPMRFREHAEMAGSDPWSTGLATLALAYWCRGRTGEALGLVERALAVAREAAVATNRAWVTNQCLNVMLNLGDYVRIGPVCEELLALCAEQAIPKWGYWTRVVAHRAAAEISRDPREVGHLLNVLQLFEREGAGIGRPHALLMTAEACLLTNQPQLGLQVVENALETAEAQRAFLHRGEMYRVRAALRRAVDPATETEAELRRAVTAAREIQAPSFELRAWVDMAQHLPNRRDEALAQVARCLEALGETRVGRDVAAAEAVLKGG